MEYELILVMFILVNLIAIKMKIPLLNFCIAVVSFFLVFLGADNIPFYPYPNLLLGLISVVSIVQGIGEITN